MSIRGKKKSVNSNSKNTAKFEVEKITNQIILLHFVTQEDMINHLLRFQEYYESDVFADTVFTLGEYREHTLKKDGYFSYVKEVEGMNFPGSTFDPFLKGLFDPLSEEEKTILEQVAKRSDDFYIIATHDDGDHDAHEHEICHGLYGTNPKYRAEMNEALGLYDLKHIYKWLKKQSYSEKTLLDEAHAYLTIDSKYLAEQGVKFDKEIPEVLLDIRRKYKPDTIY